MEVRELRDQDFAIWDEYVYGSEQGTFFHLAGWKNVMEETFDLRCHFLMAIEGTRILGLLPLIQVNSRLLGPYFTSMPDALCTGSDEAAQALISQAKELVRACGAKYFLLRDSNIKWDHPDLVTNEDHCAFTIKLCHDADQMWKAIDRRVRQHANKAIKANLEIVVSPDNLESFYPVYSQAMRELGTPTQGIRFFQNILINLPTHFTIILLHKDGEILGGWFAAIFRDTIFILWAGMLSQYYKQYYSTHSIYWETLKYACENGFQWVDLGRSKVDSGGYVFKTRWGAQPRPLYQQFYLNGISSPPAVGGSREDDSQYRLFINVWKNLPIPLIEIIGPQIRKRLPFG